MDTNELKALAKMLEYVGDTLSAMLESDAEPPVAETPTGVDWSKPIQLRKDSPTTLSSVVGYAVDYGKQYFVKIYDNGTKTTYAYDSSGRRYPGIREDPMDIINTPEPPAVEKPAVDWSKPIQLRKGTPATLSRVCDYGGLGTQRYRVTIHNTGSKTTYDYDSSGCWRPGIGDHQMDVVNVPEPPPFDLAKPVQTRDGRRVRILCMDSGVRGGYDESRPVVGILYGSVGDDTRESVHTWQNDGVYGYGDTMDLVNVPTEQL